MAGVHLALCHCAGFCGLLHVHMCLVQGGAVLLNQEQSWFVLRQGFLVKLLWGMPHMYSLPGGMSSSVEACWMVTADELLQGACQCLAASKASGSIQPPRHPDNTHNAAGNVKHQRHEWGLPSCKAAPKMPQ